MKTVARVVGVASIVLMLIGCVAGGVTPGADSRAHPTIPVPVSAAQSLQEQHYIVPAAPTPVPTSILSQASPVPTSPIVSAPNKVLAAPIIQTPSPPDLGSHDTRDELATLKNMEVAHPAHPFEGAELYVHLPPQSNQSQPLRVLLVLHGMGAHGDSFARSLISEADRNNWVVVAPTLPYGNWQDMTQLVADDMTLSDRLEDTLHALPGKLKLKLRQHVLVYGFSRGAQLAHRFALLYPEHVESVATISAGTYTLPFEKRNGDKGTQTVPFPYGVGDFNQRIGRSVDWPLFRKISFWVGVGEQDNVSGDVPRSFDPYVGQTRVERARAFQQALVSLGMDARLTIFPGVEHTISAEMQQLSVQFLRDRELARGMDD